MTVREFRSAPLGAVNVREAKAANGAVRFKGHAALFDRLTDLGRFREKVSPGAFSRALRDGHDVRLLFDHAASTVMARTASGTLRLKEDATGLVTEADLDPTDLDVLRILPKMRRGDLSQMSFAFSVRPGGDHWDDSPRDGGKPIRTLKNLDLFDVSVVTFPAYKETSAQIARSVGELEESWRIAARNRARRLRVLELA